MQNEYEIRGNQVAIFLNRRDGLKLETIISIEDFDKVNSFDGKWYAVTKKNLDSFYVNGIPSGILKTVYLHRFILEAPKGLSVDHINHNTLDNTRNNLRIVSHAENHQNRKNERINYEERGVSWDKARRKWKARVFVGGKARFERFFDKKEDAIVAAKKARQVYMPFSIENSNQYSNYSEEDLLKEYVRFHHDKKISGRTSKSGYLGVYWHKSRQRWDCYQKTNGKKIYLGSFKDKQDAINAVKHAYKI